jgi:hypothetical protein
MRPRSGGVSRQLRLRSGGHQPRAVGPAEISQRRQSARRNPSRPQRQFSLMIRELLQALSGGWRDRAAALQWEGSHVLLLSIDSTGFRRAGAGGHARRRARRLGRRADADRDALHRSSRQRGRSPAERRGAAAQPVHGRRAGHDDHGAGHGCRAAPACRDLHRHLAARRLQVERRAGPAARCGGEGHARPGAVPRRVRRPDHRQRRPHAAARGQQRHRRGVRRAHARDDARREPRLPAVHLPVAWRHDAGAGVAAVDAGQRGRERLGCARGGQQLPARRRRQQRPLPQPHRRQPEPRRDPGVHARPEHLRRGVRPERRRTGERGAEVGQSAIQGLALRVLPPRGARRARRLRPAR